MLLTTLKQRLMGDYVIDPRHDINLYTILVRDSFIPLTLILAASLTIVVFISRSAAAIDFPPETFTAYILLFLVLYLAYKKYPRQGLFRLIIFIIIIYIIIYSYIKNWQFPCQFFFIFFY